MDLNIPDEYVPTTTMTIRDIIGTHADLYMKLILISSSIVFFCALYLYFVAGTKLDLMKKYDINVPELMILPSMILFGVSFSYYWS